MQSSAATVKEYLASLTPDRREAIAAIREVILKNLGKGYEEGMTYGMIGYFIPHSIYPPGYHCDPTKGLPFAGLASQKNHMAVYLMSVYGGSNEENWFRKAWEKTGRKLDMGKCCVRFRKLEDCALDVIGEAIRRCPVKDYIAYYEKAILSTNSAASKRLAKAKAQAKPARAASARIVVKKNTTKKTTKITAKRAAKR
jgi:hypothetical protein